LRTKGPSASLRRSTLSATPVTSSAGKSTQDSSSSGVEVFLSLILFPSLRSISDLLASKSSSSLSLKIDLPTPAPVRTEIPPLILFPDRYAVQVLIFATTIAQVTYYHCRSYIIMKSFRIYQ
jgi:hypothetical protein